MFRLFTSYELCRGGFRLLPYVTKRPCASFLVRSAGRHRPHVSAGHFQTGIPVWKDALEPERADLEEKQTPDLDKWKSVMRARAAADERTQQDDEADASDDDDENLKEPGGDFKGSSSLEATRHLVTMWQQAGKLVPQEMSDEEVQTLAELTTKSSRKKYLKYLAIKEGHKRSRKEKQQHRKMARDALLEQRKIQNSDAEDETGSELKSTLILQFWGRSLDKLLAWRSAQAMLFGQPLVLDMSYESNMAKRELENTVTQLLEVEGWNRRAADPYHLHFCNLQEDGPYMSELVKRYGAEVWDRLLVTTTDQQHVDRFPREQLVYLTADSPNVLRTYDHSKIYIIGALVDRSIQSGLSLANAKRLNLATARLPLDEFLHWEIGAKNLTLDQMIRIMLTLKETGNWEEALQFVPKRKYSGFHQHKTQKETVSRNHRPRQDGNMPLRLGDRNIERPFENNSLSALRSPKESGFSGKGRVAGPPSDRENKPAATRVRTSFKISIEGRTSAGKSK
ncbi:tRNA methyltransferase 10 homolog C [Clinocottus analis]|uniref:tRNA methyltransferase 10 homolog C n=1 Tax=Clinocottus analis TaxID=304258 RepID=UPI0035C1E372